MQIQALSNRFAAQHRKINATQHSFIRLVSVSRNWMIWTVILSFLAVTKSWANTLPDFSALVAKEGNSVVKIWVC